MTRATKIVTCFLKSGDKILILKRSDKVKSMKSLWAGISGIIENNESPLERTKIEVFEELGIDASQIKLLKESAKMRIISPQYENHEWEVYPFLFSVENPKIKLNWENSDYKWVRAEEISNYETVPSLEKVLSNLL
ncbi:MAG: NUDIX domain-containing protein [Nitrososphaerota archaeon]|jgi:8-oxo-dGTP pyrophosphatase MutT (NUDIX family)|nr:NUDIX domain-containing protein [Nitrososphaerota archaeon]MDG7054243.1 NUDIX domain-containing protein [Nitrososphaerota archaeon]